MKKETLDQHMRCIEQTMQILLRQIASLFEEAAFECIVRADKLEIEEQKISVTKLTEWEQHANDAGLLEGG